MVDLPSGTVTLLFSDIEGSTHLLQQLGERYSFLLTEYRQLLRDACCQWNGQEVDTQGDALFMAFARATDGVSAAVEMQRSLAGHDWPNGVAVRARIGLHTGEPQRSVEGYIGLDVHQAARIMSAGHGRQVLLSQTTRDLVEYDLPGGVSLLDLGAHRLKDLHHPSYLFQLVISGLPADFPPLKTLDTQPNNLPVQPTLLIGREKEVAAVEHLLRREDVRLLTLTGPGGTGKTRLGLQVAAQLIDSFAHGVFFVNVAPISDPSLVVPAIAQTLEVKESTTQSLFDLLKAYLRDKQLLLLLDNFEQVISAAVQVADLLAACPQLKVMVTSRVVLHVRGEQEFAVPPLTVPDLNHLPELVALSQYEAVALFIARAQAVKPEFQLSDANARALAEICSRLDGLPLAIELAAARLKLLPPQALLARLSQRLALLTSASRDVPARQQTLRNTIEWSYHLLDIQEQQLFRRLSILVGGCTLEAIEAVCAALEDGNGGTSVLEGVASLIDKSLLQQTEQEGEEPRFVMLETIREYGLEAISLSGETEATRQAHALYYLALAEQAEPHLRGSEQIRWFARLEQEHENLRAALLWLLEGAGIDERVEEGRQQAERCLRLCVALYWFWYIRGHRREGDRFLGLALAANSDVSPLVRAKALSGAAGFAISLVDLDRAEKQGEESLALFREVGDKAGIAATLQLLGYLARVQCRYAQARSRLEEARALFQGLGDSWRRGNCLTELARVDMAQGKYDSAYRLLEESLTIYRALGDQQRISWVSYLLARLLFVSGRDVAAAQNMTQQSLAILEEVDAPWDRAWSSVLLGQIALQQGEQAQAQELFEQYVDFLKATGDGVGATDALLGLARLARLQGDLMSAQARYQESLALTSESGYQEGIAPSLEGLAVVTALQEELLRAARLWGAAEFLRETIGLPIPPIERGDYERSVATARDQLGEKAFAAAWAQGRSMTPEHALATQEPVTIYEDSSGMPGPTTVKTAPTYPAGLTAREVEVLRLVAQGLTDAQVAEQLVISPRTVNWHLTSIYSKLQITSRSAATRYAIEKHLV